MEDKIISTAEDEKRNWAILITLRNLTIALEIR
jgi:hypothetical protein